MATTTTIQAKKATSDLGTLQNGDMLVGERVANTGGVFTLTTTGSGSIVLATSGTMVTPILGTPTSGTLTNCTGLPISGLANTGVNSGVLVTDGTGVPSIGTNIPTAVTIGSSYIYRDSGTDVIVADGGSGRSTATAYAPLLGGTTATGAHQSAASGSAGQIFQSAGNAAVPTWSTATYPVTAGSAKNYLKSDGTNWASATPDTSPVAGTLAAWDASLNLTANNAIAGYATTATAAGTTTLTVASAYTQIFTGATTQTVVLPVVSTLALGTSYEIVNLSSGVVTVQSSGANTVQAMQANSTLLVVSNATSGTGASVWYVVNYSPAASSQTGSGSLVRATSPTLVTPLLGTPTSGTLTNCTGLPVAGGGTGVASTTAYAVLCGGTTSTAALQSIASVGTSGQILTSNGAGALPTFQTGSGTSKVVQRVYTQTGAVATTTTLVPFDDTIPQITEGAEFMTLAITPSNAANILDIRVVLNCAHSAVVHTTVCLFQDSTANALAVADAVSASAGYTNAANFTHTMAAGTTSSTTFRVRAGGGGAGTLTFNGSAGARTFGGVLASSIVITEYLP